MDQAIRNQLQRATQDARQLLEAEFAEQLEGTYDILPDGMIHDKPGAHLSDRQRLTRQKLVEAIQHRIAGGKTSAEAVANYTREAAFTFLNRFVAFKMLEARGLVQQCISKSEQSSGFKEFTGLAPGLVELPDKGYRLYLECLFDELSIEVKILFDRQDVASLLWPCRQALDGLLAMLNQADLDTVWDQDETIGWVYQYFNSSEERKKMREESQAPRNSHELAVRNQFFTPRYVVEFLTDNTLGRIWYEMCQGKTVLTEQCKYLVRRSKEVFLGNSIFAAANLWPEKKADQIDIPKEVTAAYQGDLSKLPEHGGHIGRWIAMACPTESAEELTGHLMDDVEPPILERVMEAINKSNDIPELHDPLLLWMLLSHFERHRFETGWRAPQETYEEFNRLWGFFVGAGKESRERNLSQEELLKVPVYIPFRAKKDPRDLKILDPACGSGHFLLYCFDLLLTIYEEAWHDEQSPQSETTGRTIREDCPTIEALREAVPGLILRHNLHGIEIDPRCGQIAAFALWMQAQRAYSDLGTARNERPPVCKINIVIAEPMPGELELLKEFTATLNPPLLGKLVEVTFEKMKLAGEAGSLLKIEEEIRDSITKARQQWEKDPEHIQMNLFGPQPARQERLDFSGITDDDFWHQAEERIYEALHRYVSRMSNGQTFSRRLFAEDAERGFAFIDLCRKRHDVVLMNPPFGELPDQAAKYITSHYASHCYNIACPQVNAGLARLHQGGYIGAIIDKTVCIKSSYKPFRQDNLLDAKLLINVDLGWEVLDSAQVETWCFVKSPCDDKSQGVGIFFDISNEDRGTMNESLGKLISFSESTAADTAILPLPHFDNLPNASLGFYKLPLGLLSLFVREGSIEPALARVRQGLGISDSWRYYRAAHEVPTSTGWVTLANGGGFAPYYRELGLCIKWFDSGKEIKAQESTLYGSSSRTVKNQKYYFSSGISYPKRTDHLNAHVLPAGCIFTVEGLGVFPNEEYQSMRVLGLLNSRTCAYLISTYCGQHKHVGYVKKLPAPKELPDIDDTVDKIIRTKRLASMTVETSVLFRAPLLFLLRPHPLERAEGMRELANACAGLVKAWNRRIQDAQTWIDREIEKSFGFDVEASHFIDARYSRPEINVWQGLDDSLLDIDAEIVCQRLISYCFGVSMGRWDTSGARTLAIDASSRCDDVQTSGTPASDEPKGNSGRFLGDSRLGVLVDDRGHDQDVLARVRAVLSILWVDRAEQICREIAEILNHESCDLRAWFRREFFDDHITRYSLGRRKAPIYWQLATPSGNYSVWLYYHRLTKDTFYRVLKDHVETKVEHEQRKSDRLRAESGPEPTRSQRGEIDLQETFVTELKMFAEEIERIAPLWNPDLNDGVIINFAPLWRLVPQHKAWQKECKKVWDKLVAGEYDWAHLAMHLWPERVVSKCHTDTSLAIAHGLEDAFWEQDEKGKWVAKDEPDEGWESTINKLVAERTSQAVKMALDSLLNAPAPGNGKKTRRIGKRRKKSR